MTKNDFVVKASPSDQALARISAEANKGSDASLAAKDRRSRPRISPKTNIAAGTVVRVNGEPAGDDKRVIGPGRGDGWALLGWLENSIDCFGTVHEDHIIIV